MAEAPGNPARAAIPSEDRGAREALLPARPTAQVYASLVLGQALNLAALSLLSAALGLAVFGRLGICLLDFAVFSNLANFALPAASIAMAVRSRFAARAFAAAMGARLWISLASALLYVTFELLWRDRSMALASLPLAVAVILNPAQWEWWFISRQAWSRLIAHRCLGGAVYAGSAWFLTRGHPSLPAATAAYALGAAAATLYLISQAGDLGFPWPGPTARRVRYLWRKSLPVALTGVGDFLFVPLGYYAFRSAYGDGPLLGAYGTAYRIILSASLFASSLYMVLLPRYARGHAGSGGGPRAGGAAESSAALFDRMAPALAPFLLLAPFAARTVLKILYPRAGWDGETLAYAAWALSMMSLSTYLHLLRMPPLTQALAAGRSWTYCGRYFLSGAVNAAMVGLAVWAGQATKLPVYALAADLMFTGWWCATLPGSRSRMVLRLSGLGAFAAVYLAWVGRFA